MRLSKSELLSNITAQMREAGVQPTHYPHCTDLVYLFYQRLIISVAATLTPADFSFGISEAGFAYAVLRKEVASKAGAFIYEVYFRKCAIEIRVLERSFDPNKEPFLIKKERYQFVDFKTIRFKQISSFIVSVGKSKNNQK